MSIKLGDIHEAVPLYVHGSHRASLEVSNNVSGVRMDVFVRPFRLALVVSPRMWLESPQEAVDELRRQWLAGLEEAWEATNGAPPEHVQLRARVEELEKQLASEQYVARGLRMALRELGYRG